MSEVAIIKGNAYEATVKALKLTNFKKYIKNKKNIVIKPNLTVPIESKKGITTDINVIRAILDQISKPEKVTIAEGPGGTPEGFETFKINDYYKLENEYDIKLVDANYDEYVDIPVKNPLALKSIKISKTAFNSDFLISAAKLKIHSVAKVTGTLKNMMGTCPKKQKMKIHAFIQKSIIDLNTVKLPDFGVIDGIVANEIDECVSYPVKMGVVLASKDCVALDSVASKIMGMNPEDVLHIWHAGKRGLGIADISKIKIIGEKIENIKKKFEMHPFNLRSDSQKIIARTLMSMRLYEWSYKNIFPVYRKIRHKFS